jgi:hypothetical protein
MIFGTATHPRALLADGRTFYNDWVTLLTGYTHMHHFICPTSDVRRRRTPSANSVSSDPKIWIGWSIARPSVVHMLRAHGQRLQNRCEFGLRRRLRIWPVWSRRMLFWHDHQRASRKSSVRAVINAHHVRQASVQSTCAHHKSPRAENIVDLCAT